MEIEYRAPDSVRAVVGSMGRTEDVRFSPGNRRLAIAAFNRGTITVLDVEIAGARVSLTGAVEIASPCLEYPHGIDFLDEDTLAVANRKGDLAIFRLPAGAAGSCALSPVRVLSSGNGALLDEPGSVAVAGRDGSVCEILVCNNSGHTVTRHLLDCAAGCAVLDSRVLLGKWINLPDGVCVSADRHWIAVSNHNTHGVLLYAYSPALDRQSRPDGVLRGVYYPHGLRFSADGRYLFVADAGAPFVQVYASEDGDWRGARGPAASVRIMDEATFLRGRSNPQEGGPKGIDIDAGMNVLVATSELQPLAFFDLSAILHASSAIPPVLNVEYELGILEQAERLRLRAAAAEARAAAAEARLLKWKRTSWRLPKPLRRAYAALRREK
jgi:DNA-binding beta-propeller fold protein YncE